MPIINIRVQKQNKEGRTIEPAPEVLKQKGPVVLVTLAPTDDDQIALRERREEISTPVTGFALIDTGAALSCIDIAAAQQAGLPVRGTSRMSSATHANQSVPVYAGKLTMQNMNINIEGAMGANLSGFSDIIALIGRDLLEQGVFIYNGVDGSVTLAVG